MVTWFVLPSLWSDCLNAANKRTVLRSEQKLSPHHWHRRVGLPALAANLRVHPPRQVQETPNEADVVVPPLVQRSCLHHARYGERWARAVDGGREQGAQDGVCRCGGRDVGSLDVGGCVWRVEEVEGEPSGISAEE